MTEQHKASAKQWALELKWANWVGDSVPLAHAYHASCLLEPRARVEALEQAENDRRFKACIAAIDAATPEQIRAVTPPVAPAPASSLVERVAAAPDDRAKIREVAAWLKEHSYGSWSVLQQEANQ